ncbi:MAG: hypothetical protein HC921_13435 [Synechococcaceae cyanobacterium SM2_3_1]|nr:hypothetical protein [Synechococcaceae cyanobacterium SM2_3_1]
MRPLDWLLGEEAQAAEYGLANNPTDTLPLSISDRTFSPGIRPATAPPLITDNPAATIPLPECNYPAVGGRYVPGVFRPNFNTTFTYVPYMGSYVTDLTAPLDGTVTPGATLRAGATIAGSALPSTRNDFLYAPDVAAPLGTPDAISPYNTYTSGGDSYTANEVTGVAGSGTADTDNNFDNGACFFIDGTGTGRIVRMFIDSNGSSSGGERFVQVEALLTNNTGIADNNAANVIAVILDEATRRPIPVPQYQPLFVTDDNVRKINDTTNRQLQQAAPIQVNALTISGLVPSRENQTAGGLQNFLRLNERWRNVPLFFKGSMINLNYSNYATGPYVQSRFEPPSLRDDTFGGRGSRLRLQISASTTFWLRCRLPLCP